MTANNTNSRNVQTQSILNRIQRLRDDQKMHFFVVAEVFATGTKEEKETLQACVDSGDLNDARYIALFDKYVPAIRKKMLFD